MLQEDSGWPEALRLGAHRQGRWGFYCELCERFSAMPFTTSYTTYRELNPEQNSWQTAIYVQVVLPIHNGLSVYALVDTGTPYCIFNT
ncbi:MAG TPA: hypothetical protein VI542_10620, partial [Candidatus Tectomicrobia bacterium]